MRNSIILPREYEHLFCAEAQEIGLIVDIPSDADKLYDHVELQEAEASYIGYLKSIPGLRQKIFQMVLLFDEIILDAADGNYDYRKLVDTGLFRVIPFDKFYYEHNPIHEDGHKEFAQHLKPAIMPVLTKDIGKYFKHMPAKISLDDFLSRLYDLILLKKQLPKEYENIIEINKLAFDAKFIEKGYFETMKSMDAPKSIAEDLFYTHMSYHTALLYELLSWQLDLSNNHDSAIINSEFKLNLIGCESYNGNIESSIEAYKILQVQCEKLIGVLPVVSNMREVLKLKETRRNDIKNLRQELSRIEQEIRDGRSEKAIEMATRSVEKASRALSLGNDVHKVSKWINRFAVPLGVAISIAGLSGGIAPLTFVGSMIPTIGKAVEIVNEDIIRGRNKWFEILI